LNRIHGERSRCGRNTAPGEHDAVARRCFRQRQRVLDLREPRPDEHPGTRLAEDFEPDLLERAHHVDARGVEPLVQPRQIFAIVAIDQASGRRDAR